jgi:hypothetical protein
MRLVREGGTFSSTNLATTTITKPTTPLPPKPTPTPAKTTPTPTPTPTPLAAAAATTTTPYTNHNTSHNGTTSNKNILDARTHTPTRAIS